MNSPYWFELAVVFGLCAVGGIALQPFCECESKLRRIAKMFLGGALAVLISATAGRAWFFAACGLQFAAFLVIHAWWLPRRHGINGWTAEPKEKYYALRGWKTK